MASSIDTTKPTAVRAFTADVRQNFTYAKSEIEALQGRADSLETVTTGLGTAAYQPTTAFATAAQGATADSATQPGDNVSALTNDAGYVDAAGALAAAPAETATTIGAIVSGATPKAAPVDADIFPISDSEAAGVIKGITFANIKSAFTAFFSATYATIASVALKANIASPNLTGIPTTPTADAGNSSTQIANTDYVQGELSTHTQPMSRVDVDSSSQIGAPVHIDSLDEILNHALSAGLVDGGAATDNGDGTVAIAEGTALIRAVDDGHTTIYSVIVPENLALSLTDNATNYISVSYNSGTPIYTASTSITSFNCTNVCIVYVIHRSGNDLNIIDAREQNVDFGRKVRRLFLNFSRFIHATGGTTLGSPSGLTVSVTSGLFYFMVQELPHDAFDTSVAGTANVNVFTLWNHTAGTYVATADQKVIDTTLYDDGTNAATLDNNKFGVTWFYMVHNTPSSLHAVMGQAQYATAAEAEAASPPASIPELINGSGTLIGFVTYEKSDVAFTDILSAFSTVFASSAATQHNGLAGLDAGETGYYGHLTSAQQVDVAALSALDGQAATVTPADTSLLLLWVSGVYEKFSISAFKTWLASLAATWSNKTLTDGLVSAEPADNDASLLIAPTLFVKREIAADIGADSRSQTVFVTSAGATGTGLTHADSAEVDLGIYNFSLIYEGALPTWVPLGMAQILIHKHDGSNGVIFSLEVGGYLRVTINASTYTATVATSLSDYQFSVVEAIVTRETATSAGEVRFYADSRLIDTVVIASAATVSVDNASPLYIAGTLTTRTGCETKSVYLMNYAMSASDQLIFYRNGGPVFADRFAQMTPIYASDYSAGVDGAAGATGGSIAGNIDAIGGEDDWLRFTSDAATSTHGFRIYSPIRRNSRYSVSIKYYIPSSNTSLKGLLVSGASGTPVFIPAEYDTDAVATAYVILGNTIAATSVFVFAVDAGGNTTFAGTAGDLFYIKEVQILRRGCVAAYEPDGIQQGQWLDSSPNKLHLSYPTIQADSSFVMRPQSECVYEWTAAINTDTTLTGIVPAGFELQDIVFNNSTAGPVSVRLGTTAGGTELFGLTALNTSATFNGYTTVDVKQALSATATTTLYLSSTDWTGGGTPPSLTFTMHFSRVS